MHNHVAMCYYELKCLLHFFWVGDLSSVQLCPALIMLWPTLSVEFVVKHAADVTRVW